MISCDLSEKETGDIRSRSCARLAVCETQRVKRIPQAIFYPAILKRKSGNEQ